MGRYVQISGRFIFSVLGRSNVLLSSPDPKFTNLLTQYLTKVGGVASESVIMQLISSKCFPVLLYGTEACPFLARDQSSVSFAVTRDLMKITLPRDAMHKRGLCRHAVSVCPSVCHVRGSCQNE